MTKVHQNNRQDPKISRRNALIRSAQMLGYGLSAGLASTLLDSCNREDPGFHPRFLTMDQFADLGQLINTILPPTDIPGGLEVGVDRFTDLMLAEATNETDKNQFILGLDKIREKAKDRYDNPLRECEPEALSTLLKEAANEKESQFFFRKLKELALLGFFTSEKIGTEVLRYDPVPGAYQGCIEIAPGVTSWTIG